MAGFSAVAHRISEECPGIRIRQAARLLTRVYDDALRPLGIQGSQLSVLVALARFGEPGATLGALAEALVLDRTTLTRNVVPLEKAGWLRVARSPGDARARVVVLTRAGERMLEEAAGAWEQAQRHLRRALGGAAALDALRAQLDAVLGRAEALAARLPAA